MRRRAEEGCDVGGRGAATEESEGEVRRGVLHIGWRVGRVC